MSTYYTWTTAKGALVEMEAKYVETVEMESEEWGTITEKVNNVIIGFVSVNGKMFDSLITRVKTDDGYILDLGKMVIDGKKVYVNVALPDDINKKVWGAYDAKVAANMASLFTAPSTTNVCPNCDTFCYRDCTSN